MLGSICVLSSTYLFLFTFYSTTSKTDRLFRVFKFLTLDKLNEEILWTTSKGTFQSTDLSIKRNVRLSHKSKDGLTFLCSFLGGILANYPLLLFHPLVVLSLLGDLLVLALHFYTSIRPPNARKKRKNQKLLQRKSLLERTEQIIWGKNHLCSRLVIRYRIKLGGKRLTKNKKKNKTQIRTFVLFVYVFSKPPAISQKINHNFFFFEKKKSQDVGRKKNF